MASAKALQKEYDKYLLTAKKYDLDGDLRRAKAYFQRALQLVPKFKKSKTNEKNAEKLKKKIGQGFYMLALFVEIIFLMS